MSRFTIERSDVLLSWQARLPGGGALAQPAGPASVEEQSAPVPARPARITIRPLFLDDVARSWTDPLVASG